MVFNELKSLITFRITSSNKRRYKPSKGFSMTYSGKKVVKRIVLVTQTIIVDTSRISDRFWLMKTTRN